MREVLWLHLRRPSLPGACGIHAPASYLLVLSGGRKRLRVRARLVGLSSCVAAFEPYPKNAVILRENGYLWAESVL